MAFITSVEEIILAQTDYTALQDLTLGQDWEKCVPFATWQRTTCSPSATADNGGINNVQFEMYYNVDVAAIRARVRYKTGSHAKSHAIYVVEFGSDCLVDQYGVECDNGGTFDIDLNQAITDIDKTFCVFYNSRASGSFGNYDENCVSARILSATGGAGGVGQVRLEKGSGSSGVCDGRLYVVEDLQSNFDVVHDSAALTQGTSTSKTFSPSVDMAESFVIASYHTTQTDDDPNTGAVRVDLQSTNQVRCIRDTGGEAIYIKFQVISLANGRVERGLVDFIGNDDQETDGSFTAVDEDVSMAWSPCGSNGQGGIVPGTSGSAVCDSYVRIQIDGTATGVVLDRLSYADEVASVAWEVIEWEAGEAPKEVTKSLTTAVTTAKDITKTAVITEGPTTAVTTAKSVTKETSVEGSATTAVTTDKDATVIKDVDGELTTAISTDKSLTKDAILEESLTTVVTTDKSVTKETTIEKSLATVVATDKSLTKITSVEGSITTGIITDKEVAVVKPVDGELTTAVTTDKLLTKDAALEESLTTNVATDKTLTKVTSVEGSLTTGVTTDKTVDKVSDKNVEGELTTAVTTDKSLTKETLITESSTTGVATDKSITKEASVEGSFTTGVTTDKEALVVKSVDGELTTAVTTDKSVTKDAVVEGSATTGVTTDKEVERLGDLYVDGESTTGITTDKTITKDAAVAGSATTGVATDKAITAVKNVFGFATTGITTDFATPKVAVAIGAATTGILTGKSFTKATNVNGVTTTAVTTDKEVGIGAQGPYPVTIHEVYTNLEMAEVHAMKTAEILSKISLGEVRFKV